ncbi:MAG: glucokinase, partial [Desulfuromonadales bacterium]|nr:glucokinase [Desulfuromonadales bacterium]
GDAAARRATDRFSAMLGAYAGDLALSAPAFGGVWITGGVLDGMAELFDTRRFRDGFCG